MKCIIFGAGKSGKNFVENKGTNVEIIAVVDNNKEKWNVEWLGDNVGYKIANPKIIADIQFDYIVICSSRYEEIEEQIILDGIDIEKIIYEESIYEYRYTEFYAYKVWSFYSEIHSFEILSKIMIREYRYNKLKSENRLEATNYIMLEKTNKKYDHNLTTLNDKIRFLEMHNYGNLEKMCTDKFQVRKYVKYCGLENILTELYFVEDDIENISIDMFPNKFVFKLNNGCGYNIICKDKKDISISIIKSKAKRWELRKMEMLAYEWHYEGIKKKYICEQLLESKNGEQIKDYKYFCCNGKICCILVCVDRDTSIGESYHYYFDRNWNQLDYASDEVKQIPTKHIDKPSSLDEMNEVAEKLSFAFPFVRVDLYNIEGEIFFGELTFTPCGGLITIQNDVAQQAIGEELDVNYNHGVNEMIYKKIYN